MPLPVSRTYGHSITEPVHTIPDPAACRSWLSRFFAGDESLAAFAPAPHHARLAPAEAAAVARALGCRDLFVLDVPDRITRERLLVHIIRAAAEGGERLLVLSPDPAAADRVVEALAADRSFRVVRALADDENPVRPSAAVSRLIGREAGTNRAAQLRHEAVQTVADLEMRLAQLERGEEYQAKRDAIERERQEIAEKLVAVEVAVRSTVGNGVSERLTALQAERTAVQARRSELERVPVPTRFGFFARLLGIARPAGHSHELQSLTDRDAKLSAEYEALIEATSKHIAETQAARCAGLAARQADLDAEAIRLERQYREWFPHATPDETVEDGAAVFHSRLELERELAVARTRQQELAAAGPDLARRLLSETQVVVGTPGSLECDPVFRALGEPGFERLMLDHAEELTEEAFDRLTALAARWVLAGDASPPSKPIANGRHQRPRHTEASLLARLARRLDREPWFHEGDRLVIRLVHLTDSQRRSLIREPVLDHTDVELAVHTGDGEPVLAEIAFPIQTTIAFAKSFLFTQLGEVVLRPCGKPRWQRTNDRLTVCWPILEATSGDWIDLEDGVREMVVGHGLAAFTAAVAFDAGCGWDEAAAEGWLAARTSPSTSRVAALPREIGACPTFAR